jgi:hypothetical protein
MVPRNRESALRFGDRVTVSFRKVNVEATLVGSADRPGGRDVGPKETVVMMPAGTIRE